MDVQEQNWEIIISLRILSFIIGRIWLAILIYSIIIAKQIIPIFSYGIRIIGKVITSIIQYDIKVQHLATVRT